MSDGGLATRLGFVMADREALRQRADGFYSVFRGVLKAAEGLCCNARAGEYGPPQNNFIHGDESYLEMVWVKMSRLVNLVEVKRTLLAEEGWEAWSAFDRGRFADSLIDLINYAAFWASDVYLAGAWPEGLQAQPEPVFDSPEVDEAGDPLAVGVEAVQCPRCQSLTRGYFGRVNDEWVVGCHACAVHRRSQQVGALLAWYSETRGSRSFVRGRYGQQSDLTHVVKDRDIKTVPRPTHRAMELRQDEAGLTVIAEPLPPEERQTVADPVKAPPIVSGSATVDVGLESGLPKPRARTLPRVSRKGPDPDPEEVDQGPRPDVLPPASETVPVDRIRCACSTEAVPVSAEVLVVERRGRNVIRLRCSNCNIDKEFRDLRAGARFLESQRLEQRLAMLPVDSDMVVDAEEGTP